MTIGDRLRFERVSQEMSQHRLAMIGGVKVNAQHLYEKSGRLPRADYLSLVAAAGLDVFYIVTGMRSPEQTRQLADDERTLLGSLRRVHERDSGPLIWILHSLAARRGNAPHDFI